MNVPDPHNFTFIVPATLDGERLDRAMAAVAAGLTRGEARRLIAAGVVFVGGRRTGIASRSVRAGDRLSWSTPAATPARSSGSGPGELGDDGAAAPRIVLERPELWIVDKPAGMPVEPTRTGAHGTLVEWLRPRGGGLIAHRLDVATSGLIVVARTREALVALNALFAAHEIDRRYVAVVTPPPPWDSATLDAPLDGRPAVTHARVSARAPAAALVELELETGRTQQIRRHLRGAGYPVVGETPSGVRTGRRLLLHAYALSIPWRQARPPRGDADPIRAVAPPPQDFAGPTAALGIELPASLVGP